MNFKRKPTITEVIPIVKEYYKIPKNGVGGSLHIVFEDGNIKNDDIDFCIKWARREGDAFGYWLGHILRRMSWTQRRKLSDTSFYPPYIPTF